jgi:TolA-binding protein
MSPRLIALVLSFTVSAASAQTYVPSQMQQMLNQQQIDIQSQQLQQLQRQTNQAFQQADPLAVAQAAQAQMQINQQTAVLNAARLQALTPGANPADLNAQLQAGSTAIQHIRPPQ